MATISEAVYFCAHFAQSSVKGGQEYEKQDGKKDFAQEIAAVIRTAQNGDRLPELLKHYHQRDVAKAVTLLADAERERLFRQMDAQTLAEIFPIWTMPPAIWRSFRRRWRQK